MSRPNNLSNKHADITTVDSNTPLLPTDIDEGSYNQVQLHNKSNLALSGTPPPIKAFYHYPPLKADEIDRQIADYLKYELIEKCVTDTPFLSNCVLVKKIRSIWASG